MLEGGGKLRLLKIETSMRGCDFGKAKPCMVTRKIPYKRLEMLYVKSKAISLTVMGC